MAGPRIGRPDRLAALDAGPAPSRRLRGPEPRRTPLPPLARADALTSAAALVAQLEPLSGALSEIATRVRRHCGATRGGIRTDKLLADEMEALSARTWTLWLAVTVFVETIPRRRPRARA